MNPLISLFGDDAAILADRDLRLLLIANIPPVIGTAMLSPVLDSLIDPLGTTAANIGLLISVFTAPGILVVPIAGVLADRFGRKPVLVAALTLFGVTGPALAFTTDFRVALLLRLLQGIGFAGIVPILITSIGDLYTGSQEAVAQGFRFTVSGVSQAVFPLLAGILVAIAWQAPFLLFAIALPIAGVVSVCLDEPTRDDGSATTDGGQTRTRSYVRDLATLLSRPRVLSMVIARSLPVTVWIGFLTYNSIIVVRILGGTPADAGALTTLGSVGFAIAASQAGRFTDLFESRFALLVGANLCLGAGLIVVVFAPGLLVAAGGILIAGVGFGITMSLYRSIVTGLASESLRAGLVSLAEGGGRLTATLTPIAMGGFIAVATPSLGFVTSLRTAGLIVALVGGGGGMVCLAVARVSAPTPAEQSVASGGS